MAPGYNFAAVDSDGVSNADLGGGWTLSYRLHLPFSNIGDLEVRGASMAQPRSKSTTATRPRNEKAIALYRQGLARKMAEQLESLANGDPDAIAEADILRESARSQNIYCASNLNREDGTFFDGKGALWLSGSRLDPFYRAVERTRTRKRVLRALSQVRSKNGELWRFVTLTLPTPVGVDCKTVVELLQLAWGLFRKRQWWIALKSAGIKSVEFTLGDENRLRKEGREWDHTKDGYHVHLHLLVLSKWIEWQALGEEWTECLEEAVRAKGIPLQITTSHGRAVVDIRLITERKSKSKGTVSFQGAIQEVCKYITKTESLLKIPPLQLVEVFHALRRRRMVEPFGQCRRSENERLAYLDTHDTSDGRKDNGGRGVPPLSTRKRLEPLRKVGAEMIARGERLEWRRILRQRVAQTQEFRRARLAEMFPHATFSRLDGHVWYGNVLRESILQAPDCVDLFTAVGVKEFAVTMLKDRSAIGRRGELYQRLHARQLMRSLPSFIKRNRIFDDSLIIRPIGHHLIQIDDCNGEHLKRLRPFAFLVVETSPENYQSWLALPLEIKKSDRDSIRSRLLRRLENVDKTASGAMRWPGSINHKPGRNRFCIRIVASNPRRFVTPAELETALLLSPENSQAVTAQAVNQSFISGPLSWPSYGRCLSEAPLKKDGSPDRSIADKNWCILALGRGWSNSEVESKLCELSEKAGGRPDYTKRTIAYAASVVVSKDDGPSGMFAAILQQLGRGNDEHATA